MDHKGQLAPEERKVRKEMMDQKYVLHYIADFMMCL